eukprot:g5650.t1
MLNTFRAHDNPALQTAIQLSNSLDLPVLVLSVLNDKWNHATERRFNFILEAMKSVSIELYDKYKIPLTLNIQCTTKTYKPWHLMLASRGAAAIIVDEPYTEPYISFASQIKRTVAPSVLVDNACILTPQLVHNFHLLDRPYKFVNATKVRRETRLLWKLKENELKLHLQKESLRLYCNNLPFEPINLNDRIVDNFCNLKNSNFNLSVSKIDYILNKLVTNIDYSVGKIVSTKGNSAAGYKRWDAFMKRGLKSYDKKRNDVLEHYNFGVSRMSCYLNLGIVSPFKMMKMLFDGSDCHNKGNKNEKFLKEFLCFRELSYCFCFYNPKHLVLRNILPTWAYNTLDNHSVDERPKIYPLDTLKQYKTNDTLWNLCQQSLVETGELHNNLRMAWGKQLILWTSVIEDAYNYLIYLNDHYALDGLAPPSYHGIGWCFGLLDSPKHESKIFGKVRFKSTASKAKHLNLEKYKNQILKHGINYGKRKFIGMFLKQNKTLKSKVGNDDGATNGTSGSSTSLIRKKKKKSDITDFYSIRVKH